ncbi:hypothetical protein PoB_004980500 [Plakobranchus ocellatus]|uniref:Uncharacterized protein n=1 Tax=Plakobranchus ocellatus TaxID=259542 RepID=A0AAV4BVE7_9GAST|nr:hypothetical protein PoB_004980500 [Plakobranchus ocellatus]
MEAGERSYQDALCGALIAAMCYMRARQQHQDQHEEGEEDNRSSNTNASSSSSNSSRQRHTCKHHFRGRDSQKDGVKENPQSDSDSKMNRESPRSQTTDRERRNHPQHNRSRRCCHRHHRCSQAGSSPLPLPTPPSPPPSSSTATPVCSTASSSPSARLGHASTLQTPTEVLENGNKGAPCGSSGRLGRSTMTRKQAKNHRPILAAQPVRLQKRTGPRSMFNSALSLVFVISATNAFSQQGDLRLLGPPSGRSAGGGARTRDRIVPAGLRTDSQATVPPTPPKAVQIPRRGRLPLRNKCSQMEPALRSIGTFFCGKFEPSTNALVGQRPKSLRAPACCGRAIFIKAIPSQYFVKKNKCPSTLEGHETDKLFDV